MLSEQFISDKSLGIYLHIPFCVQKCSYCDFYSRENFSPAILSAYVEQMCQELIRWSLELADKRIATVYLGGGTPSLLPAAAVDKILQTVAAHFHLEDHAEISMEANPASLNLQKICGYRQAGVNRISLGAQSFLPAELAVLGRVHTTEDIVETVEQIRAGGITNFNLDLIYGLPGQTEQDFAISLHQAVELEPSHLSLYLLQLDAGVPLAHSIAAGRLALPADEVVSDLYYSARASLKAAGYEHYEISNWARPGYQCRHNLIYWHSLPYLGVGSSAVSFLNNQRFQTASDYLSFMDPARDINERIVLEEMEATELFVDYLLMGLRLLTGINRQAAVERFGESLWQAWENRLETCKRLGLLQTRDDHWFLSEQGLFLSNQVFLRLLP